MGDADTIPERLAHIDEKLDAMPGTITAAVALGVKPVCDLVTRHDERIGTLERSAKGLWAAIGTGALVLIGEIFYLWHTVATVAPP